MSEKRIGILGGTFDPVHHGHFHLAQYASEEFGLDQVVFIPSASPPHKHGGVSPFHHRVAMLELACADTPRYTVNTIESELSFPSFTIDTLKALTVQWSGKTEPFFIIGSDAFLDIPTWKDYNEVLARVNFILGIRPGIKEQSLVKQVNDLGYINYGQVFKGTAGLKDVYLLQKIPPDVSSSGIRSLIKNSKRSINDRVSQLIDPLVYDYILNHQLYL